MNLPPHLRTRSFIERLQGAIMLDAATYVEIEHDPTATGQAAAVVALASIATAVGNPVPLASHSLIGLVIGGFVGWMLSTALVWLVGVRIMKHTSDYGELLRTLGFASAPHLIGVLGVVPVLGPFASLAASILGMVAYVVALREALDVTTRQAILVGIFYYLVIIATVAAMALFVGLVMGIETAITEPSAPRL